MATKSATEKSFCEALIARIWAVPQEPETYSGVREVFHYFRELTGLTTAQAAAYIGIGTSIYNTVEVMGSRRISPETYTRMAAHAKSFSLYRMADWLILESTTRSRRQHKR